MRIIVDVNGHEWDLGASELAKRMSDDAKIPREVKDILDHPLKQKAQECFVEESDRIKDRDYIFDDATVVRIQGEVCKVYDICIPEQDGKCKYCDRRMVWYILEWGVSSQDRSAASLDHIDPKL